ncbi:MAG: aldo/keto reductase [Sphaerochaetaceae bacterium]
MIAGLGCWQFGSSFGFWPNQKLEDSKQTINFALENNIVHFDSAQGYNNGQSEQILGQQIKKLQKIDQISRKNLILATKIMPTVSLNIEKLINKSLKRLYTDYIDILYIHWPKSNFDYHPMLQQLLELKNKGIIKNIGLSNFNLEDLDSISSKYPISFYQRPVSLLWSKDLENAKNLCLKKNIKLVGYSPLGLGTLSGKYNTKENLNKNDSRRNLFIYSQPFSPIFTSLINQIESIAKSNNTTSSQIALSWSKSQNPSILLLGASNKIQLKNNLNFMGLKKHELEILSSFSEELMMNVPKEIDNYFFHRY